MEKPTICITTFKRRFHEFSKLLDYISGNFPENGILVAVNGEYEEDFSNEYRMSILQKISQTPNCFPIMFTEFRSLAKLWNTMVIFSKTSYNLILNDDIIITNGKLIDSIEEYIRKTDSPFFTVNRTFSSFVITKKELDDLDYFDERLLAIGEEDGDITWRYADKNGKDIDNLDIIGIRNSGFDQSIPPKNMNVHHSNKPIFNRNFINQKYKFGIGSISGMFGSPAVKMIEDKKQYPYEKFFMLNKENIGKGEIITNV